MFVFDEGQGSILEKQQQQQQEIDVFVLFACCGLYGKRWGECGMERREIFKLRGLIRNKSSFFLHGHLTIETNVVAVVFYFFN